MKTQSQLPCASQMSLVSSTCDNCYCIHENTMLFFWQHSIVLGRVIPFPFATVLPQDNVMAVSIGREPFAGVEFHISIDYWWPRSCKTFLPMTAYYTAVFVIFLGREGWWCPFEILCCPQITCSVYAIYLLCLTMSFNSLPNNCREKVTWINIFLEFCEIYIVFILYKY